MQTKQNYLHTICSINSPFNVSFAESIYTFKDAACHLSWQDNIVLKWLYIDQQTENINNWLSLAAKLGQICKNFGVGCEFIVVFVDMVLR